MQVVYMSFRDGSRVPVLTMRTRDFGEVQFFAFVDGAWQWVDAEEFGGPEPCCGEQVRVHVEGDMMVFGLQEDRIKELLGGNAKGAVGGISL